MNYIAHYNRLIDNAQHRCILPNVCYETHHVVPRCMGGTDDKENLVDLFPEEHYVAHQLLVKIYPTNYKLIFAITMMSGKKKGRAVNNKLYGWLRRKHKDAMSKRPVSDETRQKMSATRTGMKCAEETKIKISEAQIGKIITEEAKAKIRAARKNQIISDESNIKRRATAKLKGIMPPQTQGPHTEETKLKMKKPPVTCPHCSKQGKGNVMHRFHFDNCKLVIRIG
jgi:hypothetical protein